MPIIDTQRRLSEIGRIRLGERQGNRPVKLDHFRLTSPIEGVLLKVASLYGGNVTPWEEQFQVTTTADEIPIVIPSYKGIFSEWYEEWSGGGVKKRCDGVTDEHRQCPCDCIPGQRDCKPISRLSVWLPEINTLGVWMLSSTGYNANAELGGSILTVQDLERRLQRPVKTSLRLAQRKKITGGKTFRFSVPVIEIRENAQAVLEAPAAPVVAVRAIEAAPVAIAEPPPDDLAEPVSTPEAAEARIVAYYNDSPDPTHAEYGTLPEEYGDHHPPALYTGGGEKEPIDTSQDIIAENFRKSILIACREADIDTDERHEMITNVTEGRTNSIKQLREGELPLMWSRMQTTLMGKCTVLMNEIWSNPNTAYETLHKEFGLEDDVSTWQWKQWLQVFTFCKSKPEAK